MKTTTRFVLGLLVSVIAYSGSAQADSVLPRHVVCLIVQNNKDYVIDIPASVVLQTDGHVQEPQVSTGNITVEGGPLVGENYLQPFPAKTSSVDGSMINVRTNDIDLFVWLKPFGEPKVLMHGYQLTEAGINQIFCELKPDSQNDLDRQMHAAETAVN
jgi:hypothetical protein